MRYSRNGQILLVITLGISFIALGQGGGQADRGAATQQAGAAWRGGRGGGGSGGASDFYTYDRTAGSGQAIPNAPPVETHQKIAVRQRSFRQNGRARVPPLSVIRRPVSLI